MLTPTCRAYSVLWTWPGLEYTLTGKPWEVSTGVSLWKSHTMKQLRYVTIGTDCLNWTVVSPDCGTLSSSACNKSSNITLAFQFPQNTVCTLSNKKEKWPADNRATLILWKPVFTCKRISYVTADFQWSVFCRQCSNDLRREKICFFQIADYNWSKRSSIQ